MVSKPATVGAASWTCGPCGKTMKSKHDNFWSCKKSKYDLLKEDKDRTAAAIAQPQPPSKSVVKPPWQRDTSAKGPRPKAPSQALPVAAAAVTGKATLVNGAAPDSSLPGANAGDDAIDPKLVQLRAKEKSIQTAIGSFK